MSNNKERMNSVQAKTDEFAAQAATPDADTHKSVTPSITSSIVTPSTRVPMWKQKQTNRNERPGFVRRTVNELGDRIEKLLLAGWTIAEKSADGLVRKTHDAHDGSSVPRMVVNKRLGAPCETGIIMECPEDIFNEDLEMKTKMHNDKIKVMTDPSKTKQIDSLDTQSGRASLYGELSDKK